MLLPATLTAAANRLPLPVVQNLLERLFGQALKHHPDLLDRLGSQAGKYFRFSPTDLDLSITVQPASRTIRTYRKNKAPPASAEVSGPFLALLALLEGRINADAESFSRNLTVTGDMEAIATLRSALKACGFDLPADLSGLAGPFAQSFRQVAELVRRRAAADLG